MGPNPSPRLKVMMSGAQKNTSEVQELRRDERGSGRAQRRGRRKSSKDPHAGMKVPQESGGMWPPRAPGKHVRQ